MTAALTFRAVSRSFGQKHVLRGINLDIPEGQFVAIIGKSGCGKSTLLRLLTGLDAPTDGRLVMAGGRFTTGAVTRNVKSCVALRLPLSVTVTWIAWSPTCVAFGVQSTTPTALMVMPDGARVRVKVRGSFSGSVATTV